MASAPESISRLIGQSDWGELDNESFLRELAAAMAVEVGCSRFGIRLAMDTPLGRTLKTVVMFDQALGRTVHVPDVIGDGVDAYLAAVTRCGGLITSHVPDEARIPALLRDCLEQCGVRSLMDVPISVNGLTYGTLSCEHARAGVDWTAHQIELLRRLAVKTAPALVRVMTQETSIPGPLWEPGPTYWLSPLRTLLD